MSIANVTKDLKVDQLQLQENAAQAARRPTALPAIVSHAQAANTLDHRAKRPELQVRPLQLGLTISQDLQLHAQHQPIAARAEAIAAEALHQAATAHQAEVHHQVQA